jgi:hypothetical protein
MMLEKILHLKKHVSHNILNCSLSFEAHQRNGKVERKFQTLYGRIRAMFNDSGIVNEI